MLRRYFAIKTYFVLLVLLCSVARLQAATTLTGASSVNAGKTVTFSLQIDSSLTPATAHTTWFVWPVAGSVTNGVYTAPATVTSAQTVRVMALVVPASQAVAPVVASATLQVLPPVAVSIAPANVVLGPAGTTQFSASVSNTSNTAVTWSLSPSVGTISASGLYTAPASFTGQQAVTVTAKSVSDPTKTASASITLVAPSVSISPTTASLSAGQTLQFTASVANTGSNTAVNWSLSSAVGSVSSSGLYTAPSSITSQQTVTVTATSVAAPTVSASATVTLNPAASITLPIEVMGNDGTTQTVQVNVPSTTNLSGNVSLWLQIHGLEYQTQASVQVNNSGWIAINNTNAQVQGLANNYGGIGGAYHTLTMLIPLPAGTVTTGTNTVSFQFNGTDGNSSGYRILGFNFQLANGTQVIPSSTFAQDNPANWTPPSTATSDIAAGKALYQSAALTQRMPNGATPLSIQAHCGDCHTVDGRDLKYFNYSNASIYARSRFHGLNDQQAQQIVSYIRSLTTPAPAQAHPWNPPYQPGPGLDSQPVTNWAAGAGLSAVLTSDAAMVPYISPTLTSADFNPNGNLSTRETPIAIQLPDWNHWLPQIHPVDIPNSNFLQSTPYQDYVALQTGLVPNSAQSYNNWKFQMGQWTTDRVVYGDTFTPASSDPSWSNPNTAKGAYSIALWQMVKQWELNQVNGLEGMAQDVFGPQADIRAWYSGAPFQVAPSFNRIPDNAPGILNGTPQASINLSFAWYYMQLILNDGQKMSECGSNPVDWGYFRGSITDMSENDSQSQSSMLLMMLLKSLQVSQNGLGPQYGCVGGWNPNSSVPAAMVQLENSQIWNDVSSTTRAALINGYVSNWYAVASSFTQAQYINGGWITPSDPISPGNPNANFASAVAYMIPHLQYWGLSSSTAQGLAQWAATMWPQNGYNWASTTTATCSTGSNGVVTCSTDK